MASERLSNLIKALRKLAADDTLSSDERTLAAERGIKDYLVKDPIPRKQMLDELDQEVATEAGEFWDTVREAIGHLRQTG